MDKFDKTYKFLNENYIQKGTYAYTVGPQKITTYTATGEDLGKVTNQENIGKALFASHVNQSLGKWPQNLRTKRLMQKICELGIEKAKEVCDEINKCYGNDTIKCDKDSTCECIATKIVDVLGNCQENWNKFSKIINLEME